MTELLGVVLVAVGLTTLCIIMYLHHLIQFREERAPSLFLGVLLGIVYLASMGAGFKLLGTSMAFSICAQMGLLLVAFLVVIIFNMLKTPFVAIGSAQDKESKNISSIIGELIIIIVLLALMGIIAVTGYNYYFRGIAPGLK